MSCTIMTFANRIASATALTDCNYRAADMMGKLKLNGSNWSISFLKNIGHFLASAEDMKW